MDVVESYVYVLWAFSDSWFPVFLTDYNKLSAEDSDGSAASYEEPDPQAAPPVVPGRPGVLGKNQSLRQHCL